MIRFNKAIVSGLILSTAAWAVGQTQLQSPTAQTETYRPVRQFRAPKPVIESTWSVYPQIQIGMNYPREPHENPLTPIAPGTTPSDIIPGDVTSTPATSGPKITWDALGATGYVPPDPHMAVGPNHIVVTVNTTVGFFTKSGQKLFQQTLDDFFRSVGGYNFTSDPKIVYDRNINRWWVAILGLDFSAQHSYLLLAVSDDSDPRGTWLKYKIDTKLSINGTAMWSDYPGFGYNKDAIVFGANMFGFSNGAGGPAMFVVQKAPMLTGGQPLVTSFQDPSVGTIQGCLTYDSTLDVAYAMAVASTTSIKLYAVQNAAGTPTLKSTLVSIPAFEPPTGGAVSTSGRILDSLDSRLYNAVYRKGHLLASHNVHDSSANKNMVRWYDILANGWNGSGTLPKLKQAGSIRSSGQDNWLPAINMNKREALSVLWSRCSPSIIADMMISGRKPTDAAGTLGAPQKVAGSSQTYGGSGYNRWGDYFEIDIDPTDDLTFWGVGMVGTVGGNWKTVVTNWTINVPVEDDATVYKAQSISLYQGAGSSGTVADVQAQDSSNYSVLTSAVAGLGQVGGTETTFKVGQDVGTIDAMGLKFVGTAPATSTLQFFAYNWSTSQYDFVKAVPGTTLTAPVVVEIAGFSSYVDASGNMKIVTRTIGPARGLIQPAPYQFLTNLIQVQVTNKS